MSKSGEMATLRASSALSSLAVSVVMAGLAVLAIVGGLVQDTRAETTATISKVDSDSTVGFVSATRTGDSPTKQGAVSAQRQVVRRMPVQSGSRAVGPTGEWLGVSKLAFPLLVTDLTGGVPMTRPSVMSGRSVAAR